MTWHARSLSAPGWAGSPPPSAWPPGLEGYGLREECGPGRARRGNSAGGYTWDAGPTLIMMPEILQELFVAAGRQIEDYLDLRRVDPYYRVAFEEGGHLDLTGNLPAMVAQWRRSSPEPAGNTSGSSAMPQRLARGDPGIDHRAAVQRHEGPPKPGVLASLLRSRPFETVASEVAGSSARPSSGGPSPSRRRISARARTGRQRPTHDPFRRGRARASGTRGGTVRSARRGAARRELGVSRADGRTGARIPRRRPRRPG